MGLHSTAWSAWFITFLTTGCTGKNHGNELPLDEKWVGWAVCQAYMSTLKNGFMPPHSSHLSCGTASLYARKVQASFWISRCKQVNTNEGARLQSPG